VPVWASEAIGLITHSCPQPTSSRSWLRRRRKLSDAPEGGPVRAAVP